jgi:hypothetical protein
MDPSSPRMITPCAFLLGNHSPRLIRPNTIPFHPQTLRKLRFNPLCLLTSRYRIQPLVEPRAQTQAVFLHETIPLVPGFVLPETSLRRVTTLTNIQTTTTRVNKWIMTPKLTRSQHCIIKPDHIHIIRHTPFKHLQIINML